MTDLGNREGMHTSLVHKEVEDGPVASSLLKGVLVAVVVFADLQARKHIVEVFPLHPEQTVILVLHAQLILKLLSPAVRVIAPPPSPLEGGPGITKLN